LLMGWASLIADGISMGFGDYLSSTAELNFAKHEMKREKWELDTHPEGEKQEMIELWTKEKVDEDDDEPMCRICFTGYENGPLVSPCLCSGSMRFVHLDCLEQWRRRSVNPKSYYTCENCLYRYSFRRALYAQVLRSALVLHLVTAMLLVLLLLLGSLLAKFVDERWFGGKLPQLESLQLSRSLFSLDGLDEDEVDLVASSLFSGFDLPQRLGIDVPYLLASLMVIGISGFMTLGMIGPMLWHRGQQDSLLLVMVVVGVFRTFLLIYDTVKRRSGVLLQTAERMVVDVGGSPPPPPPPAPTTAAPPPPQAPPPPAAPGARPSDSAREEFEDGGSDSVGDFARPGDDRPEGEGAAQEEGPEAAAAMTTEAAGPEGVVFGVPRRRRCA